MQQTRVPGIQHVAYMHLHKSATLQPISCPVVCHYCASIVPCSLSSLTQTETLRALLFKHHS